MVIVIVIISLRFFKGEKVDKVVDTTGAGDAFCGSLAARLMMGDSLLTAVQVANIAAARTVVNEGAQESYPEYEDMNLPQHEELDVLNQKGRDALESIKIKMTASQNKKPKSSKKRARS